MTSKIVPAARWIWNWAVIVAVTGVFPLAIAPACALVFFDGRKTGIASRIALGVWSAAFAVSIAGLLARTLRRALAKRRSRGKE